MCVELGWRGELGTQRLAGRCRLAQASGNRWVRAVGFAASCVNTSVRYAHEFNACLFADAHRLISTAALGSPPSPPMNNQFFRPIGELVGFMVGTPTVQATGLHSACSPPRGFLHRPDRSSGVSPSEADTNGLNTEFTQSPRPSDRYRSGAVISERV